MSCFSNEVLRGSLAFTVLIRIDDGSGEEMRGVSRHRGRGRQALVHGAHETQTSGIEVEIRTTRPSAGALVIPRHDEQVLEIACFIA